MIENRPWGSFQIFAKNRPVTVKLLNIKKDHRTSLQKHKNREEHWYVVNGVVIVENELETKYLKPGNEAIIPKGSVHRLTGLTDSTILEVSYGEFDESDIERIADDYNRKI